MSTQVQYRRGTAAENDAFVGALAEITVDTTNWVLRIADGATTGGFTLVGLNSTQTLTNKTYNGVSLSVTGNVTAAGVMTVNSGNAVTAIVNGGGNAVGNIGSSSKYFNTVFAQSTSALYADLAENYSADANYASGTVLVFGGNNEVTISTADADPRVAGVVSTNPAHLMNSTLNAEHTVAVALTGRVPTLVTGTVRKGDMMVSAGNGHAQASSTPAMGTVIGKALENFDGVSGTIEIVVGRV